MLSQEEDNRKKLLITEMSNINSGKAEDDFIKILVLFREKDLMRGSLERTKTDETTSSVQRSFHMFYKRNFFCSGCVVRFISLSMYLGYGYLNYIKD